MDLSTFDKNRTALVVVDVLEGDNLDTVYSPVTGDFGEKTARVTEACRMADIPVIFCCDAHLFGIDREIELWGEHGMVGTPEAEPAAILGYSVTDYVIRKRRYDSFHETSLDMTLRELGCDTIIVIGHDTNICVMHTLAGAFFRCYDTIVISDATRSFLIGDHEEGLKYFEKIYGSLILTTDELIQALEEDYDEEYDEEYEDEI
ncbi:MAG: cysteine hydrolase [Atopobiaceae bacterium]|nr:cysteine hydrolase [Atopobiaceae bacterium]